MCDHEYLITGVEDSRYMPNPETGVHEPRTARIFFKCRFCGRHNQHRLERNPKQENLVFRFNTEDEEETWMDGWR